MAANFPPINPPNYNKRMPDMQPPGEYPYVRMYQFRDGSWWRQDETPGNESYSRGHISGSYHETDVEGSHKKFESSMKHEYTTQGHTSTVDMNQHRKHGGSTVDQTTSDHYSEHGKDHMRAKGGDTIDASGGIHFRHATQGTQVTSSGDHTSDHNDGNHHINIFGDQVKLIGGTKYEQVGAEFGVYTPNGNIDFTTAKQQQVHAQANINNVTMEQFNVNATSNTNILMLNHNVNSIANMQFNGLSPTSNITLHVGRSSIMINATAIVIATPHLIITET